MMVSANGRPKIEEGLILTLKNGGMRKVIQILMPGINGKVEVRDRKGTTGRWGKSKEISRRRFWQDVAPPTP